MMLISYGSLVVPRETAVIQTNEKRSNIFRSSQGLSDRAGCLGSIIEPDSHQVLVDSVHGIYVAVRNSHTVEPGEGELRLGILALEVGAFVLAPWAKPVVVQRNELVDAKEANFWHLISTGKVEKNRVPDFRRCERIRWPRALIEAATSCKVKCWKSVRRTKRRRGQKRVGIALPDFSYVVILADRGDYVLLLTAYCVEQEHRRKKLEKEWRQYVAKKVQKGRRRH